MNNKNKSLLIFAIAAIIFLSIGVYTIKHTSYTVSEPIYVMAGYYYLTEHQTFQTGHPIATHILSAIPLLFIHIDKPEASAIYHPFEFARNDFLYYGNNNPDTIMFLARLPFLLLSLLFAWYIFRWTKELYGLFPGTIALILYIFNPDIIGSSILVMTDIAVAGFLMISCYYLWKYFKTEKRKHLILTGIFFGLAISSKSTAIFIIPAYLLMFFMYRKAEGFKWNLKKLAIIALLGVLIFSSINIFDFAPVYNQNNPFYTQSEGSRTEERLQNITEAYTSNPLLQKIIIFSLEKVPIPGSSSLAAYAVQIKHSGDGQAQYLFGDYSAHGVWYYYLFVFAVKTPIPLLILFLISICLLMKEKGNWKEKITLLLPITVIGFIFSFIVRLNLGLRHVLIILFFIIIISASAFQWKRYKKKIIPILLLLLVIWYIAESIWIAPSYLAYFNEFIGPENAPDYLIDDSLDLGQDLIKLGTYVHENNITSLKLKYSGFEKPEYRDINYENLSCEETNGTIAVSVNALYGGKFWYEGDQKINQDCYAWLREKEPIAKIGYTIYVYSLP
ncbi:glycosyltransferase family 39 protein [Candidatus Woesearchaeota archaeon]|nr:glycosyltransferase family 39 protein [Candidatus Woesearchaeota archaeon]